MRCQDWLRHNLEAPESGCPCSSSLLGSLPVRHRGQASSLWGMTPTRASIPELFFTASLEESISLPHPF